MRAASDPAVTSRAEELRMVRWTFVLMAVYFALRTAARTWVSDSLEMDEAEQMIQSQSLQWGYGPQPPLYTWVQMIFFAVLGKSVFALALLKNVLLFGTCWLTYLVGRDLTGAPRAGLAAAVSLFVIPQIVWASQNDLTHTVMATFFGVSVLLVLTRLLRGQNSWGFLLLGTLCAGGVLSKYSFLPFLLALILALLTLREGRRLLADRRCLLALVTFLALLAPHLLWAWEHPVWAFRKMPNLQIDAGAGQMQSRLIGFRALFSLFGAYLLPLCAVYALAMRRAPVKSDLWPERGADERILLLQRMLLITAMISVFAVCAVRATFSPRWLQQNLYGLPLLLAVTLGRGLSLPQFRRLAGTGGVVAAAVFVALTGRIVFAEFTGRPLQQNQPYRELAAQIRSAGISPGVIVADNGPLGAAFGMAFPGSVVIAPRQLILETHGRSKLIVWELPGRRNASARVAELAAAVDVANLPINAPSTVQARLRYCRTRTLTLGYFFQPADLTGR